jgi:hypothetical protein
MAKEVIGVDIRFHFFASIFGISCLSSITGIGQSFQLCSQHTT